jgi:deoxyribodipyrimidine photo-lyase
MTTLVWFRQDLRLGDHPALCAALRVRADKGHIIPVYIHTAETLESGKSYGNDRCEGGAARWWRHHSLQALSKSLEIRGSRLVIRRGNPLTELQQLIRETGAARVVWHRRMEPAAREEDSWIKATLRAQGIEAHSFNGNYLHEPWEITNKQGNPFQVFTPYWKAMIAAGLDLPPLPAPDALPNVPDTLDSLSVEALGLLPKVSWDKDFHAEWIPGETGAWERFETFLPQIDKYAEARDLLVGTGVSKLSPHLHFGEISPRQILRHLLDTRGSILEPSGIEQFVRELGWREFGAYLAFHFPETVDSPLDKRFLHFEWRESPEDLRVWQRGETGVPVVDAAMRCLWHTGWMHNRARMIVASFLTKNLLIDWRHGGSWTRSSTQTNPATPQAGNGPPVPEPMPHRISASSTRCCRLRNSIRTGTSFAAGYPNWPSWIIATCTRPGRQTPTHCIRQESHSAKPIPNPSSISKGAACVRWNVSTGSNRHHEPDLVTDSG